MAKYPDVALVVQGPLIWKKGPDEGKPVDDFIEFLPQYQELFEEIILSTYTEQLTEDTIRLCGNNKISIVAQTDDIGPLNHQYNIGYQTLSTLAGLKASNKKYTIKHRTDERYSNLSRLIDLFLEDDEKWVSGFTIFGSSSYQTWHAADHLFIGKTDKLIKCFQMTLDNLKQGIMEKNHNNEPAAEITFTKNWLKIHEVEKDDSQYVQIMKKYYNFVPDADMFPFVIRFNSSYNRKFVTLDSSKDDHYPDTWLQFREMDDLWNKGGQSI